jgi:hypothetical protein
MTFARRRDHDGAGAAVGAWPLLSAPQILPHNRQMQIS